MRPGIARVRIVLMGLILLAPANVASAQSTQRAYTGFDASWESYQLHDARRRRAIDRQLWLIEELKWQHGLPSNTMGALLPGPRAPYARDLNFFFAGGSRYLWGNPYVDMIRQPIAQVQIQTGPQRWESHPVYAEPGSDGFDHRTFASPPVETAPPGPPSEPGTSIEF